MIPNKVIVAGVGYQVISVQEIDDDPNTMGTCLYHKSLIKLKDGLSNDKKEQTFVHELLHACFNEAGFIEQDEDVINRVGIVLYQVLKDNKLNFSTADTN
ncbi:MAG TPA: ImmA/IrrE family metallo-endopeptidase [Bacillus bacterium]|nr:ImmA/IrrE family metallo-endopeptidase [Bacillus sp. (in: firmicutes)]